MRARQNGWELRVMDFTATDTAERATRKVTDAVRQWLLEYRDVEITDRQEHLQVLPSGGYGQIVFTVTLWYYRKIEEATPAQYPATGQTTRLG